MATSGQLAVKEDTVQHKGFLIAPSGYKEKAQPIAAPSSEGH